MSYDLMVFAPEAAPREPAAFKAWHRAQTAWSEDHSYDDPAVSRPALRAWFLEMIATFPAMNGPFASDDESREDFWTDYSVGRSVVYAAFGWSKVAAAHALVFHLAGKYAIGFVDVSATPAKVWLPDGNGGLVETFGM
jgi:hypothetical protein